MGPTMKSKQLRTYIGNLSSAFLLFTSTLLIINGLQGCSSGSGSDNDAQIETISANPIAVTLRPGESEDIQFIKSSPDLYSSPSFGPDSYGFDVGA